MKRNTRTIISVIGVLVVAGCLWALVPAAPRFIYHAGAIAATPDEAVSLRLYYTAPAGRSVSLDITSLVCDDQTQLPLASVSHRRSWSLTSTRYVDVRVVLAVPSGVAISGAIVRANGVTSMLPLGRVQVVPIDANSVAPRCTALEIAHLGVPAGVKPTVDVGLSKGVSVTRLVPDISEIASVGTGDQATSWTISMKSTVGTPVCLVYRPVIVGLDQSQSERSYLGPMIQVAWSPRAAR